MIIISKVKRCISAASKIHEYYPTPTPTVSSPTPCIAPSLTLHTFHLRVVLIPPTTKKYRQPYTFFEFAIVLTLPYICYILYILSQPRLLIYCSLLCRCIVPLLPPTPPVDDTHVLVGNPKVKQLSVSVISVTLSSVENNYYSL